MKQTLCLDARLLTAPGIGTYLNNLLTYLKDAPLKWVALIHPEQEEKLAEWPHVEPLLMRSSIYSLKEQLEWPFKIPKVDLFWSPHYNVPCLPIRGCKRLVTIHDTFHLVFSHVFRPMERIYSKYMMRAAVRLSDHVITSSLFSKEEIKKYTGIKESSISVIPHGVDEKLFYPREEDLAFFCAGHGITKPFVLYVGSLKIHKNIQGVIKAFSLFLKRFQIDMDLVIIGTGLGMRNCEDVKQLCTNYPELQGKLHFIGQISHDCLCNFYCAAKVFVFPSFYEGFGLPPLEAMRSGCPTIVANVGAMPEVCGDGALYVDPHSPEDIARCMAEVLTDESKRKELSLLGLRRSQHFCWKRSAEHHYAIIEEVLRR